jgi:hypothetical protein
LIDDRLVQKSQDPAHCKQESCAYSKNVIDPLEEKAQDPIHIAERPYQCPTILRLLGFISMLGGMEEQDDETSEIPNIESGAQKNGTEERMQTRMQNTSKAHC